MKNNIFKTVVGKVLLFFLTNIFLLTLVASVYACYGAFETGMYDGSFLNNSFSQSDFYSSSRQIQTIIMAIYNYHAYLVPVIMGSLVLFILTFVCLLSVSGKQNGKDEIVPGLTNYIPWDVFTTAVVVGVAFMIYFADEGTYWARDYYAGDYASFLIIAFVTVLCFNLFIGYLMDFAVRLKRKNLFSYTLIWQVLKLIWKLLAFVWKVFKRICKGISNAVISLFRKIPFVWKGVITVTLLSAFELIVIGLTWYETDNYMVFWFISRIVLGVIAVSLFYNLYRLKMAGEALAQGNLAYKTDTTHMWWELKKHGENLNAISEGMFKAVEKSIKSEMMKTELITNVSHDIKTPLTSIINYADLIGKEPCDNPKITEYAEVVSRQSDKLKRLLESLLELSKSSTGNIEVNLERCDASIIMGQAVGEFEERLENAGLNIVKNIPEEECFIMADRKLLWRVFDNLLSNICKYSMPGTRVFLSLKRVGGKVMFMFKNTSKEILNITPQELKERFVRGDASRNTEGNGLGLSIAESLTASQNGKLDLFIDADLFTAVISFDEAE